MNQPVIVRISSVTVENDIIKTVSFPFPKKILPGQFFMIWIPGVDEIPMSVSVIDEEIKAFTFKAVGDATDTLFQMKKGDTIGIRGPYGNGFTFQGHHHLFIGGGTGIAMIAPAVEACLKRGDPVDVILGAKTKQELFFVKRMENSKATVHLASDDGSIGFKGFASMFAENLINEKQIDTIYTCGPEQMMKSIVDLCRRHHISLQVSVERYMKCAVGICGQCCIGEGLRVCVEGPVFTGDQLIEIKDFGVFHRSASGKRVYL